MPGSRRKNQRNSYIGESFGTRSLSSGYNKFESGLKKISQNSQRERIPPSFHEINKNLKFYDEENNNSSSSESEQDLLRKSEKTCDNVVIDEEQFTRKTL